MAEEFHFKRIYRFLVLLRSPVSIQLNDKIGPLCVLSTSMRLRMHRDWVWDKGMYSSMTQRQPELCSWGA